MIITKLRWDMWNIQHITRHFVSINEVEEVIGRDYLEANEKGRWKRKILIGTTKAKRFLRIILEQRDNDEYYPIAAFDASKKDIEYYKEKVL